MKYEPWWHLVVVISVTSWKLSFTSNHSSITKLGHLSRRVLKLDVHGSDPICSVVRPLRYFKINLNDPRTLKKSGGFTKESGFLAFLFLCCWVAILAWRNEFGRSPPHPSSPLALPTPLDSFLQPVCSPHESATLGGALSAFSFNNLWNLSQAVFFAYEHRLFGLPNLGRLGSRRCLFLHIFP